MILQPVSLGKVAHWHLQQCLRIEVFEGSWYGWSSKTASGTMGKKHSKNAETRGWYSAAEKKRDTAQSSWGTQAMRLSGDSVVDWDCCCLSTARPADPVVTPEGFLYNRESLLEYMLAARQASARKLKEWEDQMGAIMKKGQADAEQEQRKLVQVKHLRSTLASCNLNLAFITWL